MVSSLRILAGRGCFFLLAAWLLAAPALADSPDVHFKRGIELIAAHRWPQAAGEFRQVVLLDPHNADAHYNLGVLYWRMGDRNMAVREFRETLRLQPSHELAAEWLAKPAPLVAAVYTRQWGGERRTVVARPHRDP